MSRTRPPSIGTPASADAAGALRRLDAFDRLQPPSGDRLLDIGCGNGLYTLHLAERFRAVVGIDVEPRRLADFRASIPAELQGRITVLRASAAELPLPDTCVDVVTAIETLEHVVEIDRALHEIRRVLVPGGRFYITVPNRLFPIETHMVVIGKRHLVGNRLPFLPWIPPLHSRWADARTYTMRALRRELANAGFTVGRPEYIMPPFDHWKAGARWVKPVTSRLERTPFRRFGVSLIVLATKR